MELTHANGDVDHWRQQIRSLGTLPPMEEPSPAPPVRTKAKGKSPATTERFKIMNEFSDLSARQVDAMAQLVWFHLWRETKSNGHACISFGQLAEKIGKSRRTVIRAVKHLEDAKLVTVVKRGRMNEGPSTYQVHGTPKLSIA